MHLEHWLPCLPGSFLFLFLFYVDVCMSVLEIIFACIVNYIYLHVLQLVLP